MNLSTKEDIINKLIKSYKRCQKESNNDEILIGRVVEKAGIKQTDKNQIFDLFGVDKYEDIFKQIPKATIINNGNRNKLVKICELEKSEEKQMENTNTKNQNRIEKLLTILKQGLYEKDEAIRLALLTAISGESIFFLGPPGCAKSMIARRIVQAFKADGDDNVKYFETLLHAYTTPDEVFGNVSFKGLNGELPESKDKEVYRRRTEGMLPEADIAFLDEIWKANSTILNSLLTIVNERKFHNGNEVKDVPLKALFTASNELPAKGQGLEALYDRLILRLVVSFIDDESNFFEMVDAPSSSEFELSDEEKKLQISNAELKEWKGKIDAITLSDEAKSVISAIRNELVTRNEAMSEDDKQNGELFEVGDRRWKKIVHILKTSAFLNDRTEIDLMDCQLIEYCIWSTEKQQKLARQIVEKCIQQNGLECDTAIDEINEQIENFEKKVDEQWFYNEDDKPLIFKMQDGSSAYKIVHPKKIRSYHEITPMYLCKDHVHSSYNRYGAYYDNNGKFMGDYDYYFKNGSFELNGKYVNWVDGCTGTSYSAEIAMKIGGLMKKGFSDIAHETLQERFTKAAYMPIVSQIESEITKLNDQKNNNAIPFKSNLFANQEYNTIITTKIDDAIRELQDALISLDKQRNRYLNTKLSSKFTVGDIILKNGIVFSATEVAALTTEQKKDVIAVVCITGEKTYAIGIEQYTDSWENISEIASDYAKDHDLPSEISSNWIIPNKDLLHMIWQNRETINKSLEQFESACTLDDEEYWSSSTNGNSAAFYQMFDEDGRIDHTTKDHKYSICVIREWKKE